MSSNPVRPVIRTDRAHDLRDYIMQWIVAYEPELVRTCITCVHFKEHAFTATANNQAHPAAYCDKFKACPPARVIAYGCKDYLNEDEIPF